MGGNVVNNLCNYDVYDYMSSDSLLCSDNSVNNYESALMGIASSLKQFLQKKDVQK